MSLRTNEPSLSAGELTDLVDSVTGDRSVRLLIGSAFASREGTQIDSLRG